MSLIRLNRENIDTETIFNCWINYNLKYANSISKDIFAVCQKIKQSKNIKRLPLTSGRVTRCMFRNYQQKTVILRPGQEASHN